MAIGIGKKPKGPLDVFTGSPSDMLLVKRMGEQMMQILGNRSGPNRKKTVWMSLMGPLEVINSSEDIIPVLPETFSPMLANMGLSSAVLDEADKAGYPKEGCPFQRGILGARLYHGVKFAPPDAVVGSSHYCDGTCKIFPEDAKFAESPMFLIDTPMKQSEKAVEYYAWQLGEFVKFLRKEGLADISPEMLSQAAENLNEAAGYMRKSEKLRNARPSPVRGLGWEKYLSVQIMGLGTKFAVDYFKLYYQELTEIVASKKPAIENERHRLMWMFFTPFHTIELINFIEEEMKCTIVFPEFIQCSWDDVDPDDPLTGFARKTMNGIYVSSPRRAELIVKYAKEFEVDGAVVFSNWGCRQTIGNGEMVKDALMREANVPTLMLDGDVIDPRNMPIGQVKTRVEAFVEMLDARKE